MPVTDKSYRLVVVSRSGTVIRELKDAQLDHATWELNGPGEINYLIPQNSADVVAPVEHANEVQLWIPAVSTTIPAHWAFHEDTAETPATASFTCPGLLGYMRGRFVTNTSYSYGYDANHAPVANGWDQLDIGADLWRQKNYDLNIDVANYAPSNVMRYKFYDLFDHQNFLDILQQWPAEADAEGNKTGFDFGITWDANGGRHFTLYYPYLGVSHTDIVLEWGRNIVDYTNRVRGSAQHTKTYTTGGSNGDIKFENFFETLDTSILNTYGHWEFIQSEGSELDINTLKRLSQRDVTLHAKPPQATEVTAVEVPDKLLGVLGVGDSVRVKIVNGRTNVNTTYRISSIQWNPGPGNLKLNFFDPVDDVPPALAGSWRSRGNLHWSDAGATTKWSDL